MAVDAGGSVWLAMGRSLRRAAPGLPEVYRAAAPLLGVARVGAGLVVWTSEEARLVDPSTGAAGAVVPDGSFLDSEGRRFARWRKPGVLELVEPGSLFGWTLPPVAPAVAFGLTPGGRRIVYFGRGPLRVVDLPLPEGDLDTWLDQVTNATLGPGDQLRWPAPP
jgi:hypothetical protein